MKIKNAATTLHELDTDIKGEIKLAEGSTKELPKMAIKGYSGAAVNLSDYGLYDPVVYNLSGIKILKNKIPYLNEHGTPLGHLENVSITKDGIYANAIHSYPSQESKEVAEGISNGMPYEASMGLRVNLDTFVYHAEGKVEMNGRVFDAPIYTVGEAQLREISATLFGRDGDTEVTKLSEETVMKIKNAATTGGTNTPSTPSSAPEATPIPVGPITPVVENKDTTPATPTPTPIDPVTLIVDNGMDKYQQMMLSTLERMEKFPNHKDLVRESIKNGWDEKTLEDQVKLRDLENNMKKVPFSGGDRAEMGNSIAVRMALAVGVSPTFMEKKVGKQLVDNSLKGCHLKEALVLCANAEGGNFNGFSDVQNLSSFMKQKVILNNWSTVNFPNLMHQVADWKMEEAWEMEAPFAPEFCAKVSSNHFREEGRIKPSGGTMWNGLNKEGKITHATFGEEDRYTTKLSTIAQIVTLKREDIINDDIGWVEEMLDLMIEGALMVPDYQMVNLIYNALTAGVVVSNTSHFTLALTAANLETVYNKVKRFEVPKDDKVVKTRFKTRWALMITPGLEKTAWEILNQERFASGPSGVLTGERNYWKDKFDIKEFQQLDNTTYNSSARADAWGLIPMNVKYAPFYIRYLNNQSKPVTETIQLPADELGFGIRGYWDVNLGYRPIQNDKLQAVALSIPNS